MGSVRSFVAAFVCMAGFTAAQGQVPVDRAKIFATFKESVVFVEADGYMYNGEIEQTSGSGFVIGATGEILTNSHVVFTEPRNYQKIVVKVRFGRRDAAPRAAEIVGRDRENDLALLQAASMPPNASAIPISMPSLAAIGDPVHVMGYPLNFPLSVVPGIISTQVRDNVWTTTSPINPGHSGGPVFNKFGQVIGVVTGGVVSAMVGTQPVMVEGIKFFVPSDAFGQILPAHAASVQLAFAPIPETFSGGVAVLAAAGQAQKFIFPDPGFKFVEAKPGAEARGAPVVTVLDGGSKALVKFTSSQASEFKAMVYTKQLNKGGAM